MVMWDRAGLNLNPALEHFRRQREEGDLRLALDESRYEARLLAQRQPREVEARAEQS
jgi:hypothetical protein